MFENSTRLHEPYVRPTKSVRPAEWPFALCPTASNCNLWTSEPNHAMNFWATNGSLYPELHEKAEVLFCTACTEVSVERNFSALAFIYNKMWCNLSDENLTQWNFICRFEYYHGKIPTKKIIYLLNHSKYFVETKI